MTFHEAATFLRLPIAEIVKAVNVGELPLVEHGGQIFIDKHQLMLELNPYLGCAGNEAPNQGRGSEATKVDRNEHRA